MFLMFLHLRSCAAGGAQLSQLTVNVSLERAHELS